MIGTTTSQFPLDTFTLSVPKDDVAFFKALVKKMGWTVNRKKAAKKTALYDPETGDYLNDATMQAIEDAHNGKNITSYESFEDFEKAMRAL